MEFSQAQEELREVMQALEELAVSYDSQDNDIAALKLENKVLLQEMRNSKVWQSVVPQM